MITFRGSPARDPYGDCLPAPRYFGEDNVAWIVRQMEDLAAEGERTYVVLVGGTSLYDYRLRVAQSHLRSDLSPSHWSHTFLLRFSTSPTGDTDIIEASLEPADGFSTSVRFNGIQYSTLGRYADPVLFPNVALIEVPIDSKVWRVGTEARKSVLRQFAEQRVVLDVTTLFLSWLGYVWCAGDAGNPLLEGRGIPSAALIDAILGTSGYDVSPALESSSSSPEAFWQSARWWQAYVSETGLEPMKSRFSITNLQLPDFGLLRPEDQYDPADQAAGDAVGQTADDAPLEAADDGAGAVDGAPAAVDDDITESDGTDVRLVVSEETRRHLTNLVTAIPHHLLREGVTASDAMRLVWRQPPEGMSLPTPRIPMSRTERLLAEDT